MSYFIKYYLSDQTTSYSCGTHSISLSHDTVTPGTNHQPQVTIYTGARFPRGLACPGAIRNNGIKKKKTNKKKATKEDCQMFRVLCCEAWKEMPNTNRKTRRTVDHIAELGEIIFIYLFYTGSHSSILGWLPYEQYSPCRQYLEELELIYWVGLYNFFKLVFAYLFLPNLIFSTHVLLASFTCINCLIFIHSI